jgi:hypothetical protein
VHRRGPKFSDTGIELETDLRPAWPHGGGEVEHFETLGFDVRLGQQGLEIFDAFFGVSISIQEMTLSLQSASHENAVHPTFKGAQHVGMVDFAGARQPDNFYTRLVGKPHYAGQIGSGKGTVMASKSNNPYAIAWHRITFVIEWCGNIPFERYSLLWLLSLQHGLSFLL